MSRSSGRQAAPRHQAGRALTALLIEVDQVTGISSHPTPAAGATPRFPELERRNLLLALPVPKNSAGYPRG
jgi:hypothetical protein